MRLSSAPAGRDWKRVQDHNRRPKRTLRELADEFGVSTNALAQLLSRSKLDPPKPEPLPGVHHTRWYDPVLMRAWWKREQDARSTCGRS